MSTLTATNRFYPYVGDAGGGGGGSDLWTLYGGTVVGLTTLTDTVSIGTAAMLADEKLRVQGGIAATTATNTAFLQVGSGDSTILSGANSFRLIYNAGTAQAEISTNGGAYVPIGAGGVSPWTAAAGVITEVVPANLVVVGSAAALTADQFQVLGNSVLRASVDSTSTFAVQDAATNPIFFVDTVNNAAFARGSFQMASGLTAEVYVESGPSTAAISGVGAGRIRYHNVGTPAWEVSINGGAYYPLITTNTLPNTAFVQNGNSFGGAARLGTNDAHPLLFETNGASRAEISTTGIFLINSAAAVSTEQLSVVGGILSAPNGVSQDAFLQVGDGALAAVGTASSARFRYNGGVAQVSLNAAAYTDLITASSLPTTAFVQGGNSFGAAAVLGTNDAFELRFETNAVTRGRFTTGGALLVGYASPVVSETLGTSGNAYVGGSLTISSAGSVTVANSGSVVITDSTTGSLATVQSSGGTTSFSVTDIAGQLVTALPGSIQIGDSVNLLTLQAANITGSGNIIISTSGGVSQLDGIIAIVSASLGPVAIQGAAGIDLSTAAEITINSAAGSAGDVLTSQGAGLPPVWAAPAPPTTAFVQGGNSFGAAAVLGTNDAFELLFETNTVTRGRFTTGGALLINAAAATGGELLNVNGSAYVSDLRTTSGTGYLESPTSTAAVSAANEGRIRYSNAASAWQVSINTAAYTDLITASSLPTTAFVQNGNSFGANAVLGTNDAFALLFETGGTTRGRFLSTGAFLINRTTASNSGIFASEQTYDAFAFTADVHYFLTTINNSPTGSVYSIRSTALCSTGNVSGLIGGFFDVRHRSSGTANNLRGIQVTAQADASANATGTVAAATGIQISLGHSSASNSGSITNSTGISILAVQNANASHTVVTATGIDIANQGGSGGVTNAYAINIATQSGASGANIGIRNAGNAVMGGISMAGTESLRVSGGGLLVDGAAATIAVSTTLSINNSGGAINIGNNAVNQAVNLGTGGTRAITIGSGLTTSSIANNFGTSGFGMIQTAATTGTPIGVVMTAGAHTGLSIAEATDVNFNLARTVTFGAGGGALALQRAYRVQGPTYAAAAALTITELATASIAQPIQGANVTVTAGASGLSMPTDLNGPGGAFTTTSLTALRVEGSVGNLTMNVALALKNTTSSSSGLQTLGWVDNAGGLVGAMGCQIGSGFQAPRFALLLRSSTGSPGLIAPILTVSQASYRFTNPAVLAAGGTPVGFLFTGTANGGTNTYAAGVEALQFNVASNQTYTFATGAITTQRSVLFQAPTYAFSAASTITDAANVAISGAPILGSNATFTRSMAIWVQAGFSRFDGGVAVKVTPGGTTLQGLGADFRKTLDPGSVSYPNGVSVVTGGNYVPATGYLSIIPAFWTLPPAINSGGGVGPPLNPGIRFNWSDGTTTIRYNTNTAASLTETRDSVDFNKDGLAIVGIDFVVDNTSGGAATVDFAAWTTDGNQF